MQSSHTAAFRIHLHGRGVSQSVVCCVSVGSVGSLHQSSKHLFGIRPTCGNKVGNVFHRNLCSSTKMNAAAVPAVAASRPSSAERVDGTRHDGLILQKFFARRIHR